MSKPPGETPAKKDEISERAPGMIGILDSSVGGLSVLREMRRCMPGRDFIYYGDTARGPYGRKSPETVASYVSQGLSRLVDMGAGLLVVAGHDTAACLMDDIGTRLSIPVLDIITSGIIPGLNLSTPKAVGSTPKAVGIIGPPLLEIAGTHDQVIRRALPGVPVFSVSAPLLEPLIESEWLKKPETAMIVKKYLHSLKLRQIDTLVLGSNHYTCLLPVIQRKMGKRVSLLNSASVLAQEVKGYLAVHPEVDEAGTEGGICRIMASDITPHLLKNAKMFYGQNVKLEKI